MAVVKVTEKRYEMERGGVEKRPKTKKIVT